MPQKKRFSTTILSAALLLGSVSLSVADVKFSDHFPRWTPSKYGIAGGSKQSCPEGLSGKKGVLVVDNLKGKCRRVELYPARSSAKMPYGVKMTSEFRIKFVKIPSNHNIIHQYKQGSFPPGLKLATKGDGRVKAYIRMPGGKRVKGKEYKGKEKVISLGLKVKEGKWYDFKVEATRHLERGLVRITVNGKKYLDWRGGTTLHRGSRANFKGFAYKNKGTNGHSIAHVDSWIIKKN